jgi:hypothetical protein
VLAASSLSEGSQQLEVAQTETFRERQVMSNFVNMKEGDCVLGITSVNSLECVAVIPGRLQSNILSFH